MFVNCACDASSVWTKFGAIPFFDRPALAFNRDPCTVFPQRLTRQRLTHFLRILENSKIPNTFGELRQNPQFFIKIILNWYDWYRIVLIRIVLWRYRIVLIFIKNYGENSKGRIFTYKCQFLERKILGKCSWKLTRQKLTRQRLTHFSSFEHY